VGEPARVPPPPPPRSWAYVDSRAKDIVGVDLRIDPPKLSTVKNVEKWFKEKRKYDIIMQSDGYFNFA